jgi:hypothetical protein
MIEEIEALTGGDTAPFVTGARIPADGGNGASGI